MTSPADDELDRVKANLFPVAQDAIEDWHAFPWHRGQDGSIQTWKPESSQALAIDVFGTLKVSPDRDVILDEIANRIGLPAGGPWSVELEWLDPDRLLGEPRQTQVDALARSAKSIILFECKFTEKGGACSQPNKLSGGPSKGLRQCNGNYELQQNPVNDVAARCALSGKGIRYWEVVPEVLRIDPEQDLRPCPFAGPFFQWMRNLVTCRAVAEFHGIRGAVAATFVDVPGLPMADEMRSAEWQEFISAVRQDRIPLRALPYEELLEIGTELARDQATWRELTGWVEEKVIRVASAKK